MGGTTVFILDRITDGFGDHPSVYYIVYDKTAVIGQSPTSYTLPVERLFPLCLYNKNIQ